jgi:hypothetical protein
MIAMVLTLSPRPENRDRGLRCARFKDPDPNVCDIHTPR